jgi:replication initiation and membrane attachment protein DnaB
MKQITENDINRLVKKILKEDEDVNMQTLRKAVDDYKQKHTPPEISKKTGEPVKTSEVPFKGYYNISNDDTFHHESLL